MRRSLGAAGRATSVLPTTFESEVTRMESSEVMRKVAAEKRAPAKLIGYVVVDDTDPQGHFRLYPQLDPSAYYLIDESCVLSTREIEDAERVEVLVTGDCEVQQVSRKFVAAADLRGEKTRRRYGCDSGCGCGCKGGATPWGAVVYYYRDRGDRIRFLVNWARALRSFGITELDCSRVTSIDAFCCRAVNDLLAAVEDPNGGYAEADAALCTCGSDC
jgi:hypothetical protein